MDLMKTLLIYMTATMTLSVQSTSAPKETPVPTPAPAAIVETADIQTAPDEVTPAPQGGTDITAVPPQNLEKPTPAPVPTITPNVKGYHNLGMGAKGKEVRRLQEKLIELRYLPEGSADGAYGRKTLNAVRKFQYYNGLKQDGVAGRATQTNLFENPDIVPNPEAEAPAETPAPAPEADKVTEAPGKAATEAGAPEGEKSGGTEETEPGAESGEGAELTAVPPEMLGMELIPDDPDDTPADPEVEAEPAGTETAEKTAAEPEGAGKGETAGTVTAGNEASSEPEAGKAEEKAEPEAETAEGTPETAEPEKAAEPEQNESGEDSGEIVENVDLDAEGYENVDGSVALNEGNGPLEFVTKQDGVPVTNKPRLLRSGAKTFVSLDDLCQCAEGWQVTDEGNGTVVLEAAGYTLAIYNEDKGVSATVDGTEIAMEAEDFNFEQEGHFINADFLAKALKGEATWDEEENTLMLRIRDKETTESQD